MPALHRISPEDLTDTFEVGPVPSLTSSTSTQSPPPQPEPRRTGLAPMLDRNFGWTTDASTSPFSCEEHAHGHDCCDHYNQLVSYRYQKSSAYLQTRLRCTHLTRQ